MSKSGSYVPQYPPSFPDANSLAPALGKHIATQDFLQPLESRRSKEEPDRGAAIGVSGSADILQLSVRNNHKSEQPSSSKSSSWPGLGLRYPQPLDINSKTRHCHQNQPAEVLSKRNALPSDEEENDSDYNRKKPRKDDSTKNGDVKLTPRSKHSATEQRRRSKINDRFQMLRELLPQGDQKKDKASFLLEVIDYVKVLQEKVRKYEAVEEKPFVKGNEIVEYKPPTSIATMNGGILERSATPPPHAPPPPPDNTPHDQSQPSSSNQENGRPVVEVSASYSQRLLETLSSAFNSAGIDLSQAHISVRLELGSTSTPATTTTSKVPS